LALNTRERWAAQKRVLPFLAIQYVNIPDAVKRKCQILGIEFDHAVLPRLFSGDPNLWAEYGTKPNLQDSASKTIEMRRTLPAWEKGFTYELGFDYLLIEPIFIDNINPLRVERENVLASIRNSLSLSAKMPFCRVSNAAMQASATAGAYNTLIPAAVSSKGSSAWGQRAGSSQGRCRTAEEITVCLSEMMGLGIGGVRLNSFGERISIRPKGGRSCPFACCAPYDRGQRRHRPKRLAMTNPSVFLSYSHDSPTHKAWVRKLAEDLRVQGVDAMLDQWGLRPGADLVAFMEAGIREAERVLLVCSSTYVRKAEQRRGGVGYEGMIVTGHMLGSTDTLKFIPLVRDNPSEPLLPTFLASRYWIDFRDDAHYAERLEELLRELHGQPRYRKPPLGRPAFLSATGSIPLQRFTIHTTTCRLRQQGDGWLTDRRPLQVEGYRQELSEDVALTLVPISAGTFWMGSPEGERQRTPTESPQHEVMLNSFWMAQTPITQAQWRAVAGWQPREGERWGRELHLAPSFFQGENARLVEGETNTHHRPVERVSWWEAIEFCSRLSQRTGRNYCLPSEAQWEYACRAGSTAAFHCGETISSVLANYDGNYSFENGPTGTDREQTSSVFTFPANAWGLHDMHGNVWEWCEDHWHDSYKGAPNDGTAWLISNARENEFRLLRGGSWYDDPGICRSAFRAPLLPGDAGLDVGFRVVCLPQDPSLNP
jgi:formylglycine-generating enzyme required for sulfatase activity